MTPKQEQQQPSDRERSAEHRDGRGQTARHPSPRDHEADGILEHEGEKDPDEDDEERRADGCESSHEPDRRRDDDDRTHRQEELDTP